MGAGAFAGAGVGFGLAQDGEHGSDMVQRDGLDGPLFGPGTVDAVHEVLGCVALGDGPGVEGGEAGVIVEKGLVGDVLLGRQELAELVFCDG